MKYQEKFPLSCLVFEEEDNLISNEMNQMRSDLPEFNAVGWISNLFYKYCQRIIIIDEKDNKDS